MKKAVGATSLTQKRYDRQASLFDFWEAPLEAFAFKRLRRRLWGEARGRPLLEIGVGTGKNLPYHPEGTRSVAVDISPRMIQRAAEKAERLGHDVDLLLADAQHLPFRDGAFNAAAATFVFCSVPDPVLGLQEVRRVLGREGSLHLLEHVRSRNPIVGKLMDWTNPLWVRVSGANINRDTVANVARAGVELKDVESRGFGIVKLIRGQVVGKVGAEPVPAERPGDGARGATSDVAHG
jgi:ubiquinone/menaquinone biosynthesis C-methylase UbiE